MAPYCQAPVLPYCLHQTPSGKTVPSTTVSRGSFLLTLSNPVQAGTYECLLEDPSVADKCVQNLSVLKRGAHVTVHQVPARLSLLDAQVDVLRQKTEEADSDHKDSQKALTSDVNDLRSELEKQTVADTAVQKQMADLTEKQNDVMTSVTSLTSRVDDLSAENRQLKEKLKQQEDEYSTLKTQMESQKEVDRTAENDEQRVYFTAYVTSGQNIPASAGQVIRFAQVVENTGNAYNPHTGVFTAPYDGGYMFLVSVDVNEDYFWLKIMKNGQEVVYGNSDSDSKHLTTTAVLSLTAGDTVTVVHWSNAGYIDEGKESIFVGFRVC
nr:hypothetical protein BaRGS_011511 [Batillaria attramentaria]